MRNFKKIMENAIVVIFLVAILSNCWFFIVIPVIEIVDAIKSGWIFAKILWALAKIWFIGPFSSLGYYLLARKAGSML